jgi:nucleoside-diphosphate-sugar epimerase
MTGRPLIIYSRGRATWRQFTYIDDITPLIVAAAFTQHLAHQIYNIGEQYAYQLTEAAHCFASAAGLDAFRADYQAARPEAAAVICEHARQIELQYAAGIPADRPETTLAAGLAKFWTAARQAWEQWPNRRNFKPPPAELPTPADKMHT